MCIYTYIYMYIHTSYQLKGGAPFLDQFSGNVCGEGVLFGRVSEEGDTTTAVEISGNN